MKPGQILLFILIAVAYFAQTRAFFLYAIIPGQELLYTYVFYSTFPLALALPFFYKINVFKKFSLDVVLLLFCFTAYIAYLLIWGVVTQNNIVFFTDDLYSYALMIIFILLGSSKVFWKHFINVHFIFFPIALLINMRATGIIDHKSLDIDSLADYDGKRRIVRALLSYKTENSISMWPFLLLISRSFNFRRVLIVVAGVSFVFFLQILFQKRAPFLRVLFYLTAFSFILPWLYKFKFRKYINNNNRLKLAGLFTVLMTILIYKVPNLPHLIQYNVVALGERYMGHRSEKETYKGGATAVFTKENERIAEVDEMLRSLSGQELILGKGLGGNFYSTVEFNDFRAAVHMGIFTFILKGGIVFLLLYYLVVLRALINFRLFRYDLYDISAFIFIIIANIFLLQESFFRFSANVIMLMIYSLCLGRLLSKRKVVLPNPQPKLVI